MYVGHFKTSCYSIALFGSLILWKQTKIIIMNWNYSKPSRLIKAHHISKYGPDTTDILQLN